MGCVSSKVTPALATVDGGDGELIKFLHKKDAPPLAALSQGIVRLVNVRWLLRQKVGNSGWVIPRHQDLRPMTDALLPPATAARLLDSNTRSVFVLSYGWLSKGAPDPDGRRAARILAFFAQLDKKGLLPSECGLFWDYASLPQKPRTVAEDEVFKQGLEVMATLYASALGTCVIQLKEIPPRPASAAGKVMLCDMPRERCSKEAVASAPWVLTTDHAPNQKLVTSGGGIEPLALE